MYDEKEAWYEDWFNEDYIKLYEYRNTEEAKKQIAFLEKNLLLNGSETILDLGCGIGRHSGLFGNKGYKVVAVDTSPTFIQEAQRHNPNAQNVKFQIRDMRYLEGLGKFDLVISMFTSFGYFENDSDNLRVLKETFHALNSKGKFFLDFLNPPYVIKNLVPQEQKEIDGEVIVITRNIANEKVIKKIAFPKRTYYEIVKLYNKETIENMLQAEGFEIVKIWGDYDESPWSEDSPRQLIFARKAT